MGRLFGAVALIVVTAGGAVAQAPGLPVINSGTSRGFTLAGMGGFGNDGAGSGTAVGVSGNYGMRRVAVGGFVSTVSGSSGADGSYQAAGATLAVKVLGGPLVPVSLNLHTGVGYSAPGYSLTGGSGATKNKTWQVPVGLGIAWVFPQPVVALKPWLAPRADVVRVSGPGPGSRTDTNFALSGGVNLGFLNGLGVDVAFDRVFSSGLGPKPLILGLGLSYSFK
ncbi:MAG: hypothetical protein ACKVZ0_08425 [Gemmatimonadales bacterium]